MIGGSNWGGVVSDFAKLYLGDGARQNLGDKYEVIYRFSIATKVDDLE